MPPEPLLPCWDRKNNHHRSDGIRSVARWRDSHNHAGAPPPPPLPRGAWDDFRSNRPPHHYQHHNHHYHQGGGHGKQSGSYQQHLFSDDSSFRATDRIVLDFRPSSRGGGGAGNGRYAATSSRNPATTSKGSSSTHKGGSGSLWDSGASHDAQRSVSDLLIYPSHPQSHMDNSSWDDHLPFKDHNDKMPPTVGTYHHRSSYDNKEQSLAWKTLKWHRSSSLSSRGSAFSHTSSSRSIGADSDETKPITDLPASTLTPAQSPSGNAAAAASGGASLNEQFDDTCPRKKQRLGWGQGLAKYEKQKVEGSDETLSKSVLLPCATNANSSQSIPSLPEKSPRVTVPSECASPVTTSSVGCSSSPGIDDKPYINAANNDNDTCDLNASPAHGFQSCLEEFSANLEHLSSATDLSSLLSDLLQLEDASSGDSNFVTSTAMNKLLLVKSQLSKALEKTECEIDLFENELKQLNSECESNGPHSVASDSLQVKCLLRPCENVGTFSMGFQKPVPLQLVSSSDMHVDIQNSCNEAMERVNGEVKDDDIDSPGTATSKFVEPLCIEKTVSACSMERHDGCSTAMVASRPASSEQPWFSPSVYVDKSAILSCDKNGNQQIESGIIPHTLGDLKPECNLSDIILASNRDSARKAFKVFSKLLPADHCEVDLWGSCSISCQKTDSLVKQKLALRKCFHRFKERVLTLKFRALQHLWKEDMRLISIRKYKAKSQRRIESNARTPHIVYQKHRSIRSRFTSPAGSLTLVPTSEIVDFTSKLLSDSQIKLCRDSLKMPALVDEKEKSLVRFVSSNGLVEDPCAAEEERIMINPWTPKEKELFLEKLATFGKDFKKIASYLDHKTTADCVEFYYKNHKSESFEKIKKKSESKKLERGFTTNTYLMTSGQKWNREVNAASLDLLGEASVIAAHADNSFKSQYAYVSRSFLGGHHYHKTCWGDDASCEKSSSPDIPGNEREATAADTLAGICGALSSEAMSSCVTSSVDPGESYPEGKLHKNSAIDESLTPKFMQSIDDEETCSDECCGEMDTLDWTDEEKSNFIAALSSYGKDFVKIARCVRSRSKVQCKIFFSKARKSLGLDVVHLRNGREGTPLSDANGGRSDTEDACVLEVESAICSTQSCSKMEIDYPLSVNCEVLDHAATNYLQTDEPDKSAEKDDMEQLSHLQTDAPEKSGENNGSELLNRDDNVALGEGLILGKCEPLVLCGDDKSIKEVQGKLDGSPKILHSKTDSAMSSDLPVTLADAGFSHSTDGVKQQHTISAEGPAGIVHSMSSDGVKDEALLATSAEWFKTDSGLERIMECEGSDDHNRNINTVVDTNNRNSSGCFDLDSNMNRISSYGAADASFRPSSSLTPNHQPHISLELLHSVPKAQIISWKQTENTPVSANSVLPGSSLLHYEDHLRQRLSSSTLNFEATRVEQHPKPVLTKTDANGNVDCMSCEKQSIVHNSVVTGNFQPAQFIVHDFHREMPNSSKLPHSLAELPLLSQHEKSSIRHRRSHSQSSSDADDSHRIGDVKLFGQILSHPSTSLKPNPMTQEADNKGPFIPKSSSRTFDMKFTDQGVDRALLISKLDANKLSGLDDFPVRSYGFWDGSRIQTGLSSLPDSSILLAKYPAAFSDYSVASSCGDHHSLPAVVKRNDRNSSSVSIYPVTDLSSNLSLPDYQVYRSYDGQPFTGDAIRHDAFSDLPKQNGLEMASFQKQSSRVVGINSMGPGVLVGGGCTGVSDPVAAIKMHYATAERYAGPSGGIRDEDCWRADVGR